MDPNNLSPDDGVEKVHQNGAFEEPEKQENGIALNDVDHSVTQNTEAASPTENSNQHDSITTDDSSTRENEESNDYMRGNNVTNSKEEESKAKDQTQQSKARKAPVKNNNTKAPSSRGVHSSSVRRGKDGKAEETTSAVSNGASARPRQPAKTRSFNDRQNQSSKHSSKSEAASSEIPTENTKTKSVKKGPSEKAHGETESSVGAEDDKPRRVGTLPNYGFSFKCGERAERRKEFYTKLEEKIHQKEVEKSNMQAKSKETQEAEIKMLRKSLTFKATPMPSFYQEPPPPKVELKKLTAFFNIHGEPLDLDRDTIPTTRAKSPKLGRKKGSINPDSDGNTSSSSQQGRLSLDEKASQGKLTKETVPVEQKKPPRKSLPTRLASERIRPSNSTAATTKSKVVKGDKTLPSATKKDTNSSSATAGEEKVKVATKNEENTTSISGNIEALPPRAVPSDDPDEAELQVNGDIEVEENPQLMQKPITAEH
ncbi:hypothetical protein Ahy_A06g030441 isoform C [Arachis hypogaea]|uniref:TPX2 C-terminal domain-containing protein n=1 Tax=Arachis hypogaea TaxID=3818 RepID=A0A445CW71_ARAHY|nr:hypothetical protein Ahy_A06g030441 isoform A [Arachis hypogaea]RYR55192.1 hypothetical protein Ahy_A06g030441 isoform B [Arachis hypogaea]RYR55193.1 hypothetical protein Ahy_A06g030441 isoform C [Arachis hypogaea]